MGTLHQLKRKILIQSCNNKDGEALEQAAQRGDECPVPGEIQGQTGWGSKCLD